MINIPRFVLTISLFLLSGCGEYHCIQPNDIGVHEKSDVVSTQQKWVDSKIDISNRVKVIEINIVPSELNFCTGQHEAEKYFLVRSGENKMKLPFELKQGNAINFSTVGNKMCKNNDDGKERYVTIHESCNDKETEYFAKTLNKADCDEISCPNKYTLGNARWFNGREYHTEEETNDTRQEKITDCNELSDSEKSKMDTYLLNLMCKKICSTAKTNNCTQVESVTGMEELIESLKGATNDAGEIDYNKVAYVVDALEKKGVKSYIPLLNVSLEGEKLEPVLGGLQTNYSYIVEQDHPKGENLTLSLDGSGRGGYNVRVARNADQNKSLYIHVANSFPEHDPGSGSNDSKDVEVDISKVHDPNYIERLLTTLKSKTGRIYYGIRDYGCDYKNNKGEFTISVTTKEPPMEIFSAIYNFFDTGVKKAFFGSTYEVGTSNKELIERGDSPTRRLYEELISNKTGTIRSTIIAMLLLYIVLYTFYYFFGLSQASIHEFLIVCIRIGIIVQLLQDNSWNFFYNNAFSLFINAPNQLMDIANFRGTGGSNVFEFLDLPLNRFLSSQSILLIVSLIFSGPLGIVAFCLVIWGFIIVALSTFNALFSFIASIAIIALLLSLAPLFIICTLFKYTRQIFFRWVGYLARFAIHPVILLIFISLISQVMDYIVYSVFNFEVCTECIFEINLKIFNPCIIYAYAAKHTPNITAIMAFIMLGHAMKASLEASAQISDSLFGSYVQEESDPGREYKQSLLGVVGFDQESVQVRKAGGGATAPSPRPQIPKKPQIPNER